jgi:hypothetical protein
MLGATAETANQTLAITVNTKLVISKAKARGSECKLALQNSRNRCNQRTSRWRLFQQSHMVTALQVWVQVIRNLSSMF